MGYITFNEPLALAQLDKDDEVVTCRHYPGNDGRVHPVKVGNSFMGMSVFLKTICKNPTDQDLSKWVHLSGFDSVKKWKEAITRQHKKRTGDLWLLRAYTVCEG